MAAAAAGDRAPAIHAIATCDTKGEELAWLAARIRLAGAAVRTIDVGTHSAPTVPVDVPRETVLAAVGDDPARVAGLDREADTAVA